MIDDIPTSVVDAALELLGVKDPNQIRLLSKWGEDPVYVRLKSNELKIALIQYSSKTGRIIQKTLEPLELTQHVDALLDSIADHMKAIRAK